MLCSFLSRPRSGDVLDRLHDLTEAVHVAVAENGKTAAKHGDFKRDRDGALGCEISDQACPWSA